MRQDLPRFLFLVPFVAARPDGVPVQELCEHLSLTPKRLSALIDEVAMVGSPDGSPDEMVELYQEGDRVYVALPQRFVRPPRFSVEETLALMLALAPLRDAGLPALKVEAEMLVQKLEALASERAKDVLPTLLERVSIRAGDAEDPTRLGVLEAGLRRKRWIDAEYYTASRDVMTTRRLDVHALIQVRGMWYAVDGQGKTFKVERFRSVSATDESFERNELDLELIRARLEARSLAASEEAVTVRIREREIQTHPRSGAALRRWIRMMIGNAEILEPASSRAAMREEAVELLARYE